MNSDREERARVRSRIAPLIVLFCRPNSTFYMEELRRFVERGMGPGKYIAPDSPGRILRELKRLGFLNYEVLNRRESLYQVKPVERPAEQAELFARAS